jgi:hypothetical protein
MRKRLCAGLAFVACLSLIPPARADLPGKAVKETAQFVMRKFGKEVAGEAAEQLSGRLASAAARHGDGVLAAVRKVGPKAIRLADKAGAHAPGVMRFVTRYGDDAARALSRPKAMAFFTRYGDDAAKVLMKHPGVAEPLVEGLGKPAVGALGALGERGGRRLAMMAEGELAGIGRTPELLSVIAKHGDPAMEFVWRHKGVLAGGAALTAFLANPEPYLNGTNRLASTVGENLVKPTVTAVGNVAEEAAGLLRWILTILAVVLAGGLALAVKSGALEKPWVRAAASAAGKSIGGRAAAVFVRK